MLSAPLEIFCRQGTAFTATAPSVHSLLTTYLWKVEVQNTLAFNGLGDLPYLKVIDVYFTAMAKTLLKDELLDEKDS